jgi:hypothetical protein
MPPSTIPDEPPLGMLVKANKKKKRGNNAVEPIDAEKSGDDESDDDGMTRRRSELPEPAVLREVSEKQVK